MLIKTSFKVKLLYSVVLISFTIQCANSRIKQQQLLTIQIDTQEKTTQKIKTIT